MTDEYSWHGTPDADDELNPTYFDDEPIEQPAPSAAFCRIKKHDVIRILRLAGARAFAVYCAIAVHCGRDRTCFPNIWTISRFSGCRDIPTIRRYIAKLVKIAAIELAMVHGKRGFRVVESDAPPEPFVMVTKEWLERFVASKDVWTIGGKQLAARKKRETDKAVAERLEDETASKRSKPKQTKDRTRAKVAKEQKVLVSMLRNMDTGLGPVGAAVHWRIMAELAGRKTCCADAKQLAADVGLSVDQFRRMARRIADYRLIEHKADAGSTRWTPRTPEPQKSTFTANRGPQKSPTEVEVNPKQVDKSNTGFKHDVRCAETAHTHQRVAQPFDPPKCGGTHWLDSRDRKGNFAVMRCQGCEDCRPPEKEPETSPRIENFPSVAKPATLPETAKFPFPMPESSPNRIRRFSSAQALPPLPTEAFNECWHVIETRIRPLRRDRNSNALAKQRINGVLRLAHLGGFVREYVDGDLVEFDDCLRREVESYMWERGPNIADEELLRLICDALGEAIGYDDGVMLGTMGPDADFPNCPRAVYAETHGGAM